MQSSTLGAFSTVFEVQVSALEQPYFGPLPYLPAVYLVIVLVNVPFARLMEAYLANIVVLALSAVVPNVPDGLARAAIAFIFQKNVLGRLVR